MKARFTITLVLELPYLDAYPPGTSPRDAVLLEEQAFRDDMEDWINVMFSLAEDMDIKGELICDEERT